MAVGKVHFFTGQTAQVTRKIHDLHGFDDLAQFAAVGACVHVNAAAHRAGDAMGKFHAAQAQPCRIYSSSCHGDAGTHTDAGIIQPLHAAHAILQADDQSGEPFIGSQYIGSCT